jgi:hypothetical protein
MAQFTTEPTDERTPQDEIDNSYKTSAQFDSMTPLGQFIFYEDLNELRKADTGTCKDKEQMGASATIQECKTDYLNELFSFRQSKGYYTASAENREAMTDETVV